MSSADNMKKADRKTLRDYFGFDDFQEHQEEVINSILAGRDTLAIMPTGGGKSLCYQYPALVSSHGLTIVVSPLIALMEDQVRSVNALAADRIRRLGGTAPDQLPAACIHSGISYTDGFDDVRKADSKSDVRTMHKAEIGSLRILYMSPEMLMSPKTIRWLRNVDLSLIVIDEVHCMTMWGLSFRRDYLKLRRLRSNYGIDAPIAAFTATATNNIRKDVVKLLDLKDPFVIKGDIKRPNLDVSIEKCTSKKRYWSLYGYVADYLREHGGKGIIYCTTRLDVNVIYSKMSDEKLHVFKYHAGMESDERFINFRDFEACKNGVMVATNAFGMGVDIPDIRFVCHYDMPRDIESYYQEIGRAGRDGLPAHCRLFFTKDDEKRHTQEIMTEKDSDLKDLVFHRFKMMESLCEDAVQKDYSSDEIKKRIRSYFSGSWDAKAAAKADKLRKKVESEIDEIDVLYVNESKVCTQIRNGSLTPGEEKTMSVGKDRFVSVTLDGKPDYFDMMVFDTVCTCFTFGKNRFRVRDILRLLSGEPDPYLRSTKHGIGRDISESIEKLRKISIRIDASSGMMGKMGREHDDGRPAVLEGKMLSIREDGSCYEICEEPPLYTYTADYTNSQFRSIRSDVLRTDLENSRENLILTHVLARRVFMLKPYKGKNIKKRNIRLYNANSSRSKTAVYTYIGMPRASDFRYPSDFTARMDALEKKVYTILTHFMDNGFISGLKMDTMTVSGRSKVTDRVQILLGGYISKK